MEYQPPSAHISENIPCELQFKPWDKQIKFKYLFSAPDKIYFVLTKHYKRILVMLDIL